MWANSFFCGYLALQDGHKLCIIRLVLRRGGRAAECTGLENQRGLIALREFKSLLLRHIKKSPNVERYSDFLLSDDKRFNLSGTDCLFTFWYLKIQIYPASFSIFKSPNIEKYLSYLLFAFRYFKPAQYPLPFFFLMYWISALLIVIFRNFNLYFIAADCFITFLIVETSSTSSAVLIKIHYWR